MFFRAIEDRGHELEPNVSTTDMNSPSVKERESPGHGSCSNERYNILLLNLFIFYFNNCFGYCQFLHLFYWYFSSMDNCRCSASEPCWICVQIIQFLCFPGILKTGDRNWKQIYQLLIWIPLLSRRENLQVVGQVQRKGTKFWCWIELYLIWVIGLVFV